MPLLKPNAPYCLLEDGRRGSLFENPVRWIKAERLEDVAPALHALEAAATSGYYAAGYMRYEAGAAFQSTPTHTSDGPLLCFGIFGSMQMLQGAALDAFWTHKALSAPACSAVKAAAAWSKADYQQKVARILEHLAAGDIYQANLTFPLEIEAHGSAEALYARLRRNQPAPYSGFLAFEDDLILSLSPERFFSLQDDVLAAQPMKGTAPATVPDAATNLQQDPKNRAENLMITDLLRNDLSQVAERASVKTPALFEIEHLPSVYQMTSRVTAKRRADASLADIMAALFPCGSVTGAPKRSAMRIIRAQEDSPRGIYCGAIGMIAPDSSMSFNVPIRTMVQTSGRTGTKTQMSIGSGVVADSTAQGEFDECLLKADFLTAQRPDFSLIETMAFDQNSAIDGLPALWPLHLERLARAAAYFQFPSPSAEIAAHIRTLTRELAAGPYKLRLLYSKHGEISITAAAFPVQDPKSHMHVALGSLDHKAAPEFLRFKTTNRSAYGDALRRAQRAAPCDEVFLIDADGRLTEGSYTNIFIQRDGHLLTPQSTGTFLPGVYREHLLQTGKAKEAELTPADFVDGQNIFAGNAVRGLCPVTLV